MSSPSEAQSGPATSAPPAALPATASLLPSSGRRPLRIGEWRLLALILLLFIFRDLPWRLEESGQAEQAFTSLEMVRAGHWWFQHLPGSVQAATQPPALGWTAAVLYYLTAGNWDLAWRLPSLLAGLSLVVLLWHVGEQMWPHWGGTVAAGAFALNFLTPRLAMLVRPDLPLAFETGLLGVIVWSRVRPGQPWSAGARWAVFCVLLAALMTDGPIVYVFLLPGMTVHRWISRRRALRPAPDVWGGWWHWLLPLLPYLFWLERGAVTEAGFSQQIIGHQLTGRLASSGTVASQEQPIYFYALQLLICWAPWSLLFLAVRLRARRVWWRLCTQPGPLWLVCWAAGGLVCLSFFPAKPLDRIFPVVPPLCLVLTGLLAAARVPETAEATPAAELHWPQNWSRWTLGLACAVTVCATITEVTSAYRGQVNALTDFGTRVRSLTEPARCELVLTKAATADDASMLVYLRRLSYLDPAQAIQLQSTGEVERIVLDVESPRSARGLLSRFDSAHPVLVSGGGGKFVLLSNAVPAAANP